VLQPIEVVKAGYEAFGQGDVLGVLSLLAEDVSISAFVDTHAIAKALAV
jgi:ketosteroid isomerase-like protein